MKYRFQLTILALAITAVLCCCQTYYTKSFRLSTEDPEKDSGLTRLVDGPLGEFQHSQLYLRVVALYESNNKLKMRQNRFYVVLEQRLSGVGGDTILVDSLVLTLSPSGERQVLPRQKLLYYEGDYSPQPRYRSTFGSIVISPDIETMRVDFTARSGTPPETRQYNLTLIRFEGETRKFGIRPKDEL